jgi:hypothetical protein
MSPVKYKYVQALCDATVNFPLNVNEVYESYSTDDKKAIDVMSEDDKNHTDVFDCLILCELPVFDKYMDVLIKWYGENKGKYIIRPLYGCQSY